MTHTVRDHATRDDLCPSLRVVEEADDYTSSLAGVTVDGVRVGKGARPNVVQGIPGRDLTVSSSYFGFPMTCGAHVPMDRVVAIYVHRNAAGSRWCGVAMREHSVYVYAPGSEHVAINHPGLHVTFAVTEPERLMDVAERCGLAVDIPENAGLYQTPRTPALGRFRDRLGRLGSSAFVTARVEPHQKAVLASFAELLDAGRSAKPLTRARGLDSRVIVADCIEYARAIERLPSITELCLAAHVSERRVRSAFAEEFDRSPTRYFRTWALDQVHRRLRDATPDECTVTQAACDLGFEHLGRFSGWYREVYGETPSATLRAV